MFKNIVGLSAILIASSLILSCSGKAPANTPTAPDVSGQTANHEMVRTNADPGSGHHLWASSLVRIDPDRLTAELFPLRAAADHWNILNFLEKAPCSDCLQIAGMHPGPDGTVYVDILIKHPFENPNLTGFDVRGIVMFNGSRQFPVSGLNVSDRTLGDGELVNAEGHTTLYNPTTLGHGLEGYLKGKLATPTVPNCLLNGYKRFITDQFSNTRNAFYAGDEIIETYCIHMPDPPKPWVFGYAIDACWAEPINKPVDDPMQDFGPDANCEEPWKIEVTGGPITSTGQTVLTIDVYDRQGTATHSAPVIECPDLFDGSLTATLTDDSPAFARYQVTVENPKSAPQGQYECLVWVEDNENDPVGKPWLDLTAYQVFELPVAPLFNPADVTPPWLVLSPRGLAVEGNYAYLAGDHSGLHIIDITDKQNPQWMTRVQLPTEAVSVAISSGYAYVAGGSGGLHIVDVDPPQDAYLVKTVATPEYAYGVGVYEGYALVGGGTGLQIVDVEPIESAQIVQTVSLDYGCREVIVSGGYAYVGSLAGVDIIDIDPPESASAVGAMYLPTCLDIAISGEYAYFAGEYGLAIADISTPEAPQFINYVAILDGLSAVTVSGEYAYASGTDGLFHCIDINPPGSLYEVSSCEAPGTPVSLVASGQTVYVADSATGFHVADISNPGTITLTGGLYSPSYAEGIALSGQYAYVACGQGGLQIVDVLSPENAQVVGWTDLDGCAYGIGVMDGYAYVGSSVSSWESDLMIVDVDPPTSPMLINSFWTDGEATNVFGSDGYVHLACLQYYIIDAHNPASAFIAGSINTGEQVHDVDVQGTYSYFGNGNSGLRIVDCDPPEQASIVKTVKPPVVTALEVSGDYAYACAIADYSFAVVIFDVNPIDSASVIKTVTVFGPIFYDIALSNGYAFVAAGGNGILVFDVDPPESAGYLFTLDTPGFAYYVAASNGYLYVGDMSGGLRIIRLW